MTMGQPPIPANPLHDSNSTPTDLRGLDPPDPLLRILDSIESGGGPFVFLLAREPFPLYPMLAATGWRHGLRRLPDGVELTVFRDPRAP